MYDFEDGRRVIKTENRTVYITKAEPTTFWKITFKDGNTPKYLQGMYTTPKTASEAAMNFINNENFKLETKRPKPKFKTVGVKGKDAKTS